MRNQQKARYWSCHHLMGAKETDLNPDIEITEDAIDSLINNHIPSEVIFDLKAP